MVLISPYLAITVYTVPSGSLLDAAVSIKSASDNFETAHGSEYQFEKGQHDKSTIYLIQCLWCAYHADMKAPLFSTNLKMILEEWSRRLHKEHVCSNVVQPISPDAIQGPTDDVLAKIYTNLHNMQIIWECLQSTKDSKDACEFGKLEDFKKHLILNASSESDLGPAASPTQELNSLLN